jgi:hypothetical protein
VSGPPAIKVFRQRWEALLERVNGPTGVLVAIAITLHLNEEGEGYPGTAALRKMTKLGTTTIKSARKRLTDAKDGIFDITPGGSSKGGRRLATVYHWRPGHQTTGSGDDRVIPRPTTGSPRNPQVPMKDQLNAARLREPRRASASAKAKKENWVIEAVEDWERRYGPGSGSALAGRIGKVLKPLVRENGWSKVRPAWHRYVQERDATYASPNDFAAKYSVWATPGHRVATGQRPNVAEVSRRVLRSWDPTVVSGGRDD